MKTRSAKAKGRRVQNWLHDELHYLFPELEPDDIIPRQMGGAGEDIMLSPAARKLIPCSFECKNVEKLSLHAAMRQAKANANGLIPVVIFKKNRIPCGAFVPTASLYDIISVATNIQELCHINALFFKYDASRSQQPKNISMKRVYDSLLHDPPNILTVAKNDEYYYIMQAVNFLDIIKNADKELKSKLAREASRA